ncbi:MCE family protein [Saccharopolyspora rhizosphaerae]|uniref:MCE family protein n=1 Tax=Saccharopolyspora rhizosphaerae TaxID=2492662 RepID=A0A426JM94_9PSEU|nr:MlaD family protein [Saccharopolyspora rhizosphaerae]RRO14170.1 MCE family protein [Saccharopolyspora rhizosphaerae]
MISQRTKLQIGAFLLIALVGITYVGATYAGLDRLVSSRGYTVVARFRDSGGIFTNAEVTYRGLPVGRVGPLRLTPSGVDVHLDIEDSAPPVPADTEAVVANRSAVGEQYVDLRPRSDGGPHLAEGSVITSDRTSIPVPPEELLANVDRTVDSIPIGSLQTVVTELDLAFTGLNGPLGTLLDTSRAYTREATEHLPQTLDLITSGRRVLETQREQGAEIASFSRDLHLFASQLRSSDQDLRRVIGAAPPAAEQVSGLLRESGPQLGTLLGNLLTTANVYRTRLDGVEQLLVTYPSIAQGTRTTVPGDGRARFGLVLNSFDPFVCTRGYESTQQRAGTDLTDVPANLQAHCAEPPGSPTNVRGAERAREPG